ncbi:MAG: type IX secretion system sortase PorU [Rhizobacter sp.]|nr:type IX secretion system sortase PorU [Chlorobiales bacterium]
MPQRKFNAILIHAALALMLSAAVPQQSTAQDLQQKSVQPKPVFKTGTRTEANPATEVLKSGTKQSEVRSEQSDVILISASETEAVIEFRPKWRAAETCQGTDGITYTRIAFEGGTGDLRRVGLPDFGSRDVSVMVGGLSKPVVQIVAAESEEIKNILLSPVPRLDRPKSLVNLPVTTEVYEQSADYAAPVSLPLAEASEVYTARGYALTSVKFTPMTYNAAARTLRKFTRIVVRIQFEKFTPSASFQPLSQGDDMFSGLINYTAAKSWQRISQRPRSKTPNALGTAATTPSVLASDAFYKLEIKEEGLYRLDKTYLQSLGIAVASLDPRKLKLYFNGGTELDSRLNGTRTNDLTECAILVAGESDGKFDDNDYVLFYVKSVSGIRRNPSQFAHYLNRQSNSAFAFLAVGSSNGKRIGAEASLTNPAPFVPTSFRTLAFVENDRLNFANFGLNFFDSPLNTTRRSASYTLDVSGIDKTKQVSYRFYGGAATVQSETISFQEGTTALASVGFVGNNVGNYYVGRGFSAGATVAGTVISGEQAQVKWTFTATADASQLYPDWTELEYWKKFEAKNNLLVFGSITGLTANGAVQYQLQNLTGTASVWDITNLADVRAINGAQSGTAFSIQTSETTTGYREYAAFTENAAFKRPASFATVPQQNLHGIPDVSPPEYIVVYSKDFEAEALRLAEYRSSSSEQGPNALKTLAVEVDKIYNEFGGGKQDYSAIRDFVKYLWDNAPSSAQRPKYVVLFGDGDWDFRDITGKPYKKVPMYESNESFYELSLEANPDDFFVAVDGTTPDFTPDLAVGRITVQSLQEARTVVSKIIDYETKSFQGDWRNSSMFVADDGPNGTSNDADTFSRDSENTIANVPQTYNPVKLYAAFYPRESVAGGVRRPAAYNEIINQLNRGTLVMNFIGHGNPNVLTAEQIFVPATSLPLLTNRDRLTLGVTATCDFGRADDPFVQSGAERMFLLESGGASGMITTNRAIYISSGSANPPKLFKRLFERKPDGILYSIGESFLRFKYDLGRTADADKFCILGDPAMRLVTGKTSARIDSIGGFAVSGGAPDTLKALQRVSLSGSVRNTGGTVEGGFNGTASVVIYDAPRTVVGDYGGGTVSYLVQNAAIYKGTAAVQSGRFKVNFIVPKDISYSTARGKVSLYLWKESEKLSDNLSTATGYTSNLVITGTDASVANDVQGPDTQVYLNDEQFRSGNTTNESPVFIAKLSDPSGINLAQGVGHAITLTIDGDERTQQTLNDFYQPLGESFTDGEVRYQLRGLAPGKHTVKFKVWDTYNNSSEKFLTFTAENSSTLAVEKVYNFPNPFRDRTAFIFYHNRTGDDLETKIKIYTVGGRLIKTLEQTDANALSRVRIEWDGRDSDNAPIANGVYLYKVIIRSLTGEFQRELIERLAIVR